VWRCTAVDGCGAQWATWDEGTTCPFCHLGIGEWTGFTLGDVVEAADAYGFVGDLPVHVSEPVPELVPLTTLGRDLWVGLPVFHPCAQSGLDANWLRYDVGVVLEVEEDGDVPGELRCRFVAATGGPSVSLRYAPGNLWVPKVLAERLAPLVE